MCFCFDPDTNIFLLRLGQTILLYQNLNCYCIPYTLFINCCSLRQMDVFPPLRRARLDIKQLSRLLRSVHFRCGCRDLRRCTEERERERCVCNLTVGSHSSPQSFFLSLGFPVTTREYLRTFIFKLQLFSRKRISIFGSMASSHICLSVKMTPFLFSKFCRG